MADDLIALFELALVDGEVKTVEDRHYRLVPADRIEAADLKFYAEGRRMRFTAFSASYVLAAGDRVSIEIEGIGRLTNREEVA